MNAASQGKRLVRASNFSATYNAGVYESASDADAIAAAREHYRDSSLGRAMRDVGAFRFYVVARGDAEIARVLRGGDA